MEHTQTKQRHPSRRKRILLIVIVILVLAAAGALWWYISSYSQYSEWKGLVTPVSPLESAEAFEPLKDELQAVPGFSLAAENDRVALYVKTDTAEVAVYDKANEVTVYSNPQDADQDAIARATNLENLKSQFILNYLDSNAKEGTAWSSYAKSVANGQVSYEKLPDGLRVVYNLSSEKIMLVPDQLTPEWFEILSNAGKKQAKKSYEEDPESGLYVLKSKGVSARHRQQLDMDARNAGFTMEDYEEMQALRPSEGEESAESLSFTITLDWHLTDDGVRAVIPLNGLGEFGNGQIRSIQLLPFFGSAGAEETGCLVLPEGSGALLYFNNGKSAAAQYNKNIYDMDLVDSDYATTQNTESVRLAMFGICREKSGILASCERGATIAAITADTAGRNNNRNFAYYTFSLRRTDTLQIAGEDVIVAEKDLYPIDCSVRYTLLGEKYSGPDGIARAFREQQIAAGKLAKEEPVVSDIPFYYDVIGGIKETAHWLGIQYLRVLPMTTFQQAEDISTELMHENITNQRMNLQGWMNGGYYHDPVNSISVLGQLGGERGLSSLKSALDRCGGALYPDASIQFVTNIARGFFASEEASRYYAEGYVVELGAVNPVSLRRTGTLGYPELGYKLLSPKFLPRYAQRFTDALNRLKLSEVSLRDLGQELHADKRRTNVISREADLDLAVEALRTIADGGRGLMVTGGNDYTFPYISHVLNAPLSYTPYPILDEEYPLWEMVVHGSLSYTGSPINLQQSKNLRVDLLRLIAYGSSVHYTFTARDSAEMKYTGLNSKYATTFSAWKADASEAYHFVNDALKSVSGAAMVSFARLSDTLSKTVYSNGVTIYVNTGETAASGDGYSVKAMNYLVTGGEAQ